MVFAWSRRTTYHPPVTGDLFASLSERLRDAHALVRRLDAPPERKAAVTKRLIAITDASKHGLRRASERLDALIADLDAGRLPTGDGDG